MEITFKVLTIVISSLTAFAAILITLILALYNSLGKRVDGIETRMVNLENRLTKVESMAVKAEVDLKSRPKIPNYAER